MTHTASATDRFLGSIAPYAILTLVLAICTAATAQSVSFSRTDISTGLPLSGIVIEGDFNRDGNPDIIVATHSSTEAMGIYELLGNGDSTFSSPTFIFSGCCSGLTTADVNNDGKLDLVFSSVDSEIWALLGNGDGTFAELKRSPGVAPSGQGIFADFNRDGKLDIAYPAQDGGIAVSLGNGDGTFGSPTIYPISGGFVTNFVVASDFRGIGKIDLAASNPGSPQNFLGNTVSVLLGNGDGTFGAPTDFVVGTDPGPLVIGDFNGDGRMDLAVANFQSSSVSILLGNGDGTFLPKTDYPLSARPLSMAVSDFNNDGRLDVVVGAGAGTISVFTGNGNGTFGLREDFATLSFSPVNLAVADFNLDHKSDLAVGYSGGGDAFSLFLNTTVVGLCTAPPVVTLFASPTSLWPPNGKMLPVTVSGTITDTTGCTVTGASYSVADEYGQVQPRGPVTVGSGGAYSFTIWLQASRLGSDLDGRLYTITVNASNNAGITGSQVGHVIVPHDRRH